MKPTDYDKIVNPLLTWYASSGRDLPWRKTKDPYRIWLSEIMLQQTRVEAVKGYYDRFLTALPTVSDLAAAGEENILKLWEGLGYYSRVRYMQQAAILVTEEYEGALPADYAALLKLPGIGPYTAAAIASIAFSIPKAVVDGNVLRVITRLGEDGTDIADARFRRDMADMLDAIIPGDVPGTFNQAIMDLGAMVCTPNGIPKCEICPLARLCKAHASGTELSYPVKSSLKPRKIEKITVFIIHDGERVAIRKRPNHGLLAGMYEPVQTPGHLNEKAAVIFLESLPVDPLHVERIENAKHIFTHKEWHMIAYEVKIAAGSGDAAAGLIFTPLKETVSAYPIPSAYASYRRYLGI
ncbi:MAG: A/G-specific adenine glycosylase [Lachnospiraceae bacterium]|nr:A/G-specific adenine glycosylase [Lachnospiraceae bacterium]